MDKRLGIVLAALLGFPVLGAGPGLFAQTALESPPLRRVALFSSGTGFFEHAGRVAAPARVSLFFDAGAVNDVLKSLIIGYPSAEKAGALPWVRYPLEDTLYRTLRSLRIDLSGEPDMAAILRAQRGAEIEIPGPELIRGRILALEYRPLPPGPGLSGGGPGEPWLSLSTPRGIRWIALRDMGTFNFTDPLLQRDLSRALDLIQNARSGENRELVVELPGPGTGELSIGYVIPVPVWKAAYRLDLSGAAPRFQGWAIVDNDGDMDWNAVELSLAAGRPVSFIQNLYAPYYLVRPELPLSIAGTARARTYDRGWAASAAEDAAAAPEPARSMLQAARKEAPQAERYGAPNQAAGGGAAPPGPAGPGDSFLFTLPHPVTLARRQSAMLPLVEGVMAARRVLVFGEHGFTENPPGTAVHPAISAELTNTTGMRLPAGPVTVFDGGTYGGDGLLAFFPEGERQIISFGEDLSVTGTLTRANTRTLTAVTLGEGVMIIRRRLGYEGVYHFQNAAGEARELILEHPISPGASLTEPPSYAERTGRVYRFAQTLPGRGEQTLRVREESPLDERILLTGLSLEGLLSYAVDQEIPPEVREKLRRAVELKREADAADQGRADTEARRSRLIAEQDRIRRNLEAAGNQSPQGQEYLKRLARMDGEIDELTVAADRAVLEARAAREAYESYLTGLSL
jgi:hypothetical protein